MYGVKVQITRHQDGGVASQQGKNGGGRWNFQLIGNSFILTNIKAPAYSSEACEETARNLCRRLGLRIQEIRVIEGTRVPFT